MSIKCFQFHQLNVKMYDVSEEIEFLGKKHYIEYSFDFPSDQSFVLNLSQIARDQFMFCTWDDLEIVWE